MNEQQKKQQLGLFIEAMATRRIEEKLSHKNRKQSPQWLITCRNISCETLDFDGIKETLNNLEDVYNYAIEFNIGECQHLTTSQGLCQSEFGGTGRARCYGHRLGCGHVAGELSLYRPGSGRKTQRELA